MRGPNRTRATFRLASILVLIALALLTVLPGIWTLSAPIAPLAPRPMSGTSSFIRADAIAAATGSLALGVGPANGHGLACSMLSSAQVTCQKSAPPGAPKLAPSNAPTWTNLNPSLATYPSTRFLGMMTYDAHDQYVLMFGGFSGTGTYDDTWTFQHGTWTNISGSQTSTPGARYLAAMAYDPIDHYVVLFGGHQDTATSGFSGYSDTWTFANGSWKDISSTLSTHPSERWRANMVYDAADQYLLLFGGTDTGNSIAYNDTWTFVHGGWTNISAGVTGHPQPRFRFNMAYDAKDGYVVVFGGCTVSPSFTVCASNNTWKYVGKAWTNMSASVGHAPKPRVYEFLTYDNSTGSVLLFGGDPYSSDGVPFNDTWEFANGTWTDLTKSLPHTPAARGYGVMTYTPEGYVVLYGGSTSGQTSGKGYSDTWAFGPGLFAQILVAPVLTDANLTVHLHTPGFSSYLPLNYSYAGLPPGCVTQNSSYLNCTPIRAGNYSATVGVRDTRGDMVNESANFTVVRDPQVLAFGVDVASVDLSREFNLTARVGGGLAPYSYEYTNLPRPCTSANSSTLACRPGANGTFTIHLRVFDVAGYPVFSNVTVHVNALPRVASFQVSSPVTDVNLSVTFQALVDFGSPPYSFSYSGLPPGCAGANLSVLTCRPMHQGVYPVVLNVTDSSGISSNSSTTLSVNPTFVVTSLSVAPTAVDVGQSFQLSTHFGGGTGVPRFHYDTAALGCFVGNASSATCTPSNVGTFTIQVTGTDLAGGVSNISTNVTVNDVPWVSQVTTSAAVLDVGQPFTVNVTVGGGTSPLAFSYAGLSELCGLQIGPTLQCVARVAGPLEFRVTATDHVGRHNTSAPVIIEVNADPVASSFTTSGAGAALVGRASTFTVVASGGTGALGYVYHGLPPGCVSTDTVQFSCYPATVGAYEVTVNVTDSVGLSSRLTTWLNVTQPSVQGTTTSFTSGTGLYAVALGVVAGAVGGGVIGAVIRRRRAGPPEPPAETLDPVPAPQEPPEWSEG